MTETRLGFRVVWCVLWIILLHAEKNDPRNTRTNTKQVAFNCQDIVKPFLSEGVLTSN